MCSPFNHVWVRAGGDTSTPFPDDLLCSCGTIHWKNRDHPERELTMMEDDLFKALEEASIYDFLKFEELDNES